jgi:methylmalonyl-CoA/ethylmalonyl-CoA epimerase
MSKLPFNILGIEHVAIAVNELGKPSKIFGDLLGIKQTITEDIPDQKVITDIYDTGRGKVELLVSTCSDSPITKFLEKRGPGLHHIAFKVDKLQSALDYLKGQGIQLIDETPRIGAEGLQIAFLHPNSTSGMLVELCEVQNI